MKISIVTGFFLPVPPLRGGATERSWYVLAKAFAAAGHEVTFVSREVPELPRFEMSEGVRHTRLSGFNHRRRLSLNLVLDFIWGFKVALALPRADVVICNTVSMPAWLPFFRPKVGKVAVMVGRIPKGQIDFYGAVARIYVPSAYVAGLVSARGFQKQVRVIGNPIEWSLLQAVPRTDHSTINIGFAGRIHPEKGIELLLRAAKRLSNRKDLPPWRFSLIGPTSIEEGGGGNPWVGTLKDYSERELKGRVSWLPAEYNPAKLAEAYATMDIFCYPSLADHGETFGVSVAEAMASGCAVVVSSLPCFSDLIGVNDTGLMFDHHSPHAEELLEGCLSKLISDPDFRRAMAAKGQAQSRRFDFPAVAANILQDLALLAGARSEKP